MISEIELFSALKIKLGDETASLLTRYIEERNEALKNSLVTEHILDMKVHVLEQKIIEAKFDLIKWMAGALVAQAALIATLVKLL